LVQAGLVGKYGPVPFLRHVFHLLMVVKDLPLEVVVVLYLEVPPPGLQVLLIGIRRRQLRVSSLSKFRQVPGGWRLD